jgi:PPOX class probable F420-dependent enzyme
MPKMTENQWREFVMTGTRTGKLAVIRADGRPHVTPVWFVLDGDDIVLTTHGDSIKGRALRRDPRISMSVDDQEPPFSFVVFEGEARLSEDPDDLRHWATAVAARYMGAGQAEAYGARNGIPGELLVRIRPSRVTAAAAISA